MNYLIRLTTKNCKANNHKTNWLKKQHHYCQKLKFQVVEFHEKQEAPMNNWIKELTE